MVDKQRITSGGHHLVGFHEFHSDLWSIHAKEMVDFIGFFWDPRDGTRILSTLNPSFFSGWWVFSPPRPEKYTSSSIGMMTETQYEYGKTKIDGNQTTSSCGTWNELERHPATRPATQVGVPRVFDFVSASACLRNQGAIWINLGIIPSWSSSIRKMCFSRCST